MTTMDVSSYPVLIVLAIAVASSRLTTRIYLNTEIGLDRGRG
jgi:hypothetical protein